MELFTADFLLQYGSLGLFVIYLIYTQQTTVKGLMDILFQLKDILQQTKIAIEKDIALTEQLSKELDAKVEKLEKKLERRKR